MDITSKDKDIMKVIERLPEDIIHIIKEYIPHRKLVFVNSYYYDTYHHLIRRHILNYESYIRDTIRRDNEYVFGRIIRENIDAWIHHKNYRYKNIIFSNYIYFVLHYCIENSAEQCREIMIEYFAKRDLCRNLHKKNIIKYIKWKN